MGGANSQVLLNETEMEAAVRDLRDLLGPFQVRPNRCCFAVWRVRHVPKVMAVMGLAFRC